MTIDLRFKNTFFINKEIFLNPKVTRRERAVYIALCLLVDVGGKFNIKMIAQAAQYNFQITRQALNGLEELGFIKWNKNKKIDLLK